MLDCSKTENFLREKQRMCKENGVCEKCELGKRKRIVWCKEYCEMYPQEAIEIVQQWSDSHPQKTFLDDVLEKFPKARKEDVVENICPDVLGYESKSYCEDHCGDCATCWNRPYIERTDENV